MDEIDLKLLRLLQKNARTPSRPLQVRFAFPPLRFPRVLSGWKTGCYSCVYARSGPAAAWPSHSRVHSSGYAAHPARGILSVHCCVLECARVQLRDRQLLHADQGVVRLDAGAGRLYRTSAEIRQDRNTDRVFLAGAAESHCGMRKSLRVQAFSFVHRVGIVLIYLLAKAAGMGANLWRGGSPHPRRGQEGRHLRFLPS